MAGGQPTLNWEASATATNRQVSSKPPAEVETCLKNARFLHLATCNDMFPHVSLMNYTYMPSTPFHSGPVIVMTTNPSSKKTLNLVNNPHVSLLVHDWVSHRPPTRTTGLDREGSPPPQAAKSSLASLLLNINTSALSRISATIDGEATILKHGSADEEWYKHRHLENHTFSEDEAAAVLQTNNSSSPTEGQASTSQTDGAKRFIKGEEVCVVLVRIKSGRVADWKGGVKDWQLAASEPGVNGAA